MRSSKLQFILTFLVVFLLNGVSASVKTDLFTPRSSALKITQACTQSLASVATFCTAKKAATCFCKNVDYAGSYFYCVFQHIEDDSTKKEFMNTVNQTCNGYSEKKILAVYENATSHLVKVSDVPHFNKSVPISFPVYYSEKFYNNYYDTMENFYNSYHHSFYYGAVLSAYFPVIFFFDGLIHWLKVFFPQKTNSVRRAMKKVWIVRVFEKHVTIPSLFNGTHAAPEPVTGGHYPTRLQSIFITAWWCLTFIFLCTNYRSHIAGSKTYPSKSIYLSRLIADRAGIMGVHLMVITFFLSGRNNIFLWWTGWKQSTFYAYHKAVARATVLVVCVHAIGYVIRSSLLKHYHRNLMKGYWICGAFALVAASTMVIQGLGRLRKLNYEIFYILHVFLALLVLIMTAFHLKKEEYTLFSYIMGAFWAFDRFARIVRILYFGVRTAKVTVIHDEVLMISIPRHKYWPVYPGAFGYIYFMKPTIFWQSHPFSIIPSEDGKHINFYIKVKKGATKTILKHVQKQKSQTAEIKVMFEGPYGSEKPLDHYRDILFYSSGNGIPGVYPYVMNLLKDPENRDKSITLYWIIQHIESVEWFMDELAALQNYSNVETVVYVTRHPGQPVFEVFDKEKADKEESTVDEMTNSIDGSEEYIKVLPNVEFRYEKPNIEELVRSDVSDLGSTDVAVVSCGHNAICDTIRRTVADISGTRTSGTLDYIEELQAW